jgi:hypothetical protein
MGEYVYPSTIQVDYDGKVSIKDQQLITNSIRDLYVKYGMRQGYGDLAKKIHTR